MFIPHISHKCREHQNTSDKSVVSQDVSNLSQDTDLELMDENEFTSEETFRADHLNDPLQYNFR